MGCGKIVNEGGVYIYILGRWGGLMDGVLSFFFFCKYSRCTARIGRWGDFMVLLIKDNLDFVLDFVVSVWSSMQLLRVLRVSSRACSGAEP